MVRTAPFLAAMFLVCALGLAGIPPLSGFISKFALIDAGIAEGQYLVIGISIAVSLLTLFAMIRIWNGVFWSPPEDEGLRGHIPATLRDGPVLMIAPTAALVACSLAIAAAAGPIYAVSERTAQDLLDRQGYIEKVLGP
jgi:multicomponent Na+:H+ antiporter subunit D